MKMPMPSKASEVSLDPMMAEEGSEMPAEANADLAQFDDQTLLDELKKRGYEIES